MMTRRVRFVTGLLASALLLVPFGASATVVADNEAGTAQGPRKPAASADQRHVDLRVPRGHDTGDAVSTMRQIGSVAVTSSVARLANGQVRVAPNLWDDGQGLRFPAYKASSNPPRAVVRVTHNARSGDPFAPGTRDFQFGIYFKKDRKSSGTTVDNGDNLMQRGVWTDTAQYKLQVDDDRPACIVKGDRGRVLVSSTVTLNPSLWYQAECARSGNTVRLTVKEYRTNGSTRTVVTQKTGAIGSLSWPQRQTPLAIGGVVGPDGAILPSSSDQFNGWASHPWLEISD